MKKFNLNKTNTSKNLKLKGSIVIDEDNKSFYFKLNNYDENDYQALEEHKSFTIFEIDISPKYIPKGFENGKFIKFSYAVEYLNIMEMAIIDNINNNSENSLELILSLAKFNLEFPREKVGSQGIEIRVQKLLHLYISLFEPDFEPEKQNYLLNSLLSNAQGVYTPYLNYDPLTAIYKVGGFENLPVNCFIATFVGDSFWEYKGEKYAINDLYMKLIEMILFYKKYSISSLVTTKVEIDKYLSYWGIFRVFHENEVVCLNKKGINFFDEIRDNWNKAYYCYELRYKRLLKVKTLNQIGEFIEVYTELPKVLREFYFPNIYDSLFEYIERTKIFKINELLFTLHWEPSGKKRLLKLEKEKIIKFLRIYNLEIENGKASYSLDDLVNISKMKNDN